jgi:hypothetical protein
MQVPVVSWPNANSAIPKGSERGRGEGRRWRFLKEVSGLVLSRAYSVIGRENA